MNDAIVVGTEGGLVDLGDRSTPPLDDPVIHLAAAPDGAPWAVGEDGTLWRLHAGRWGSVAEVEGLRANCVLPLEDGGALVGTSEARLLRLGDEGLTPVAGFDRAEGRERWFTPWGGPPDVRSLTAGPDGVLYANVHVGGVLRSHDEGDTWEPTALDIESDIHQVLADPREPGVVLAASAFGLAVSHDAGDTWEVHHDGLHATYCRAVAITDGGVLVSASRGPRGGQAAIYRFGEERFERSLDGLPEWFDGNIDTHCLDARGATAALGTASGDLFLSRDGGESWERLVEGLEPIRAVLLRA